MSAIFNFQSLLSVILLLICTCAYLRAIVPALLDRNKTGLRGFSGNVPELGRGRVHMLRFVAS